MIQLELPLQTPNYSVINEKDKILQYQLMVLKQGIMLEAIGLKKRGKSCLSIAKKTLGYPRNTKREEILQALDALINTFKIK
jgi:hypothetical protein